MSDLWLHRVSQFPSVPPSRLSQQHLEGEAHGAKIFNAPAASPFWVRLIDMEPHSLSRHHKTSLEAREAALLPPSSCSLCGWPTFKFPLVARILNSLWMLIVRQVVP